MPSINKKKLFPVLIGLSATLTIIANIGGAYSFAKEITEKLSIYFGISNNLINILLIGFWMLLLFGALVYLFTENSSNATNTIVDHERKRKSYLRWLLKDMRGRLESSFDHAVFLELSLRDNAAAVLPLTFKHHSNSSSPAEEKHFNKAIGENPFSILLLGAPGSGKTTTILTAINELALQANQDPTKSIPVLINLSKWNGVNNSEGDGKARRFSWFSAKLKPKPTLSEWIAYSLASLSGAGLNQEIVSYWLKEEKLALFLDGLDEMEDSLRGGMVSEINEFIATYPDISITVCSRLVDYEALVNTTGTKLRLEVAMTINPLSNEQINEYLDNAECIDLKELIAADYELRKMASSPLDLSIMVLAYRAPDFSQAIKASGNSMTLKRMALFDVYVRSMFQRKYLKQKKNHLYPESILLPEGFVSSKKIDSAYRYFGWIAKLLSAASKTYFAPGKIFEFYLYAEGKTPFYKKAVNISLLILSFVPFLLIKSDSSNIATKALPCLLILISFIIGEKMINESNNPDLYQEQKIGKNKERNSLILILLMSIPLVFVILGALYVVFNYVFFSWKEGPWLSILFFAVSLTLIKLDHFELPKKINLFFDKKNIINISLILTFTIPAILLSTHSFTYQSEALLAYMLLCAGNLITHKEIGNTYRRDKIITRWIIINLALTPVMLAGFIFYKNHSELITPSIFMMSMGLPLLILEPNEKDFRPLGIYLAMGLMLTVCLFMPPLGSFPMAIGLSLLLYHYSSHILFKAYVAFGSQLIVILLKAQKILPIRTNAFLRSGIRSLLIKGNVDEIEFIHRRIRDYFAIREFLPKLGSVSLDEKDKTIHQISRLKDASCDILLELIDDSEPRIRMSCIRGLGMIGSAIAASGLIEAERKTSGDINRHILKSISKVNDISAAPSLIAVLNTHPVTSGLFDSAIAALTTNLESISSWDNIQKMKQYLERDNIDKNLKLSVKFNLELKELKNNQNQSLSWDDFPLPSSSNEILTKQIFEELKKLSNETLAKLFKSKNDVVANQSFHILSKRDLVQATEALFSAFRENPNSLPTLAHHEINKKILAIAKRKDLKRHPQLFLPMCRIMSAIDPTKAEKFIISRSESLFTENVKEILKILSRKELKVSTDFLIKIFKEITDARHESAKILYQVCPEKDFKKLLGLIESYPQDQDCAFFIELLASFKYTPLRRALSISINSKEKRIQNAAILAIGQLGLTEHLPLLKSFYQSHNEENIEPILFAIAKIEPSFIKTELADLFLKFLKARKTITAIAIKHCSNEDLLKIASIIKDEGILVNNCTVKNVLATELYKRGFKPTSMDLLFLPSPKPDELNQKETYYSDDELFDFSRKKISTKSYYYSFDEPFNDNQIITSTYIYYSFDEQPAVSRCEISTHPYGPEEEYDHNLKEKYPEASLWVINHLCRLYEKSSTLKKGRFRFYNTQNLSSSAKRILEITAIYDTNFAREMLEQLLEQSDESIGTIIRRKLSDEISLMQRKMLILFADDFNIWEVTDTLLEILNEENIEEYPIIADALAHLHVKPAIPKIIQNLKSTKEEIVVASINALSAFDRKNSLQIKGLLELITENPTLEKVLKGHKSTFMLEQLSPENLNLLLQSKTEKQVITGITFAGRLGLAIYIPFMEQGLGQSESISKACEGALRAIGTPSATSVLTKWENRQ